MKIPFAFGLVLLPALAFGETRSATAARAPAPSLPAPNFRIPPGPMRRGETTVQPHADAVVFKGEILRPALGGGKTPAELSRELKDQPQLAVLGSQDVSSEKKVESFSLLVDKRPGAAPGEGPSVLAAASSERASRLARFARRTAASGAAIAAASPALAAQAEEGMDAFTATGLFLLAIGVAGFVIYAFILPGARR